MAHPRFLAGLAGLVSIALASSAGAGVNTWTQTGPEGGFTIVVAANPAQPSTVLAATYGGIYRSTNGGTSWSRSQSPTWVMNNFTFDPANANRVFSGSGYLMRSDDGGVTFTQLPNTQQPPSGVSEAWFNRDGSYLFVSTGSAKVYRTSDLGANWTDVTGTWPSTNPIEAMGIDPNDANTLYVAVRGSGVYKSTTAGTSWALTGAGPATSSTYVIHRIVVKPGDSNRIVVSCNDGIYVSGNGGTAWSHPYPYGTSAIAINQASPQSVAAIAYNGAVLLSADSGDSFPTTGANLRGYYQLTHLEFETGTSGRLWVASGDGPLLSADAGVTFARRTSGMRAESLASLTVSDDGTAYALFSPGPGGVFKRGANGWQAVNNNSLMTAGLFSVGYNGGPLMYEVAVAPQNGNFLYAIFYNDAIVKSIDGGSNWTYAGSPVLGSNRQFRQIAIDPSNTNVAYAGSQTDGVWKTVDAGQNWIKRSSGLPDNITAFVIDRADPLVVYVGASGSGVSGVYKTSDGGMNWSPAGTFGTFYAVLDIAVDPSNSRVVYAAMGDGLHKSTDAGANWTLLDFGNAAPIGSGGARSINIDPALPTTLISGMTALSGGFLRSVDGGATWARFDWASGISTGNGMNTLIADPSSPGRVFSGGSGTGIAEYEVSPDLTMQGTSVTGAGNLWLGQSGTATYAINNVGPHASSPSQVRITVPASITFASTQGCTFAAPLLTCTVPAMAPAGNRELSLNFTANSTTPSTGVLSASLIAHEIDSSPGNNLVEFGVTATRNADVAVAASGAATAVAGATFTRTLTVTNNGPNPTVDALVTLGLSAGMTLTATTTRGSCTVTATAGSCELGGMASGVVATITLTASVATAGTAEITASVGGSHTDAVTGNDAVTSSITITAPPPPVASSGGGGSGKSGGGGRFDWLTLGLLGLLMVRLARVRRAPARRRCPETPSRPAPRPPHGDDRAARLSSPTADRAWA
jgi:hypothetical protein